MEQGQKDLLDTEFLNFRYCLNVTIFTQIFFLKNYPLALQKPFLKIQRVPPLDVEKKMSSNQVFIKAI